MTNEALIHAFKKVAIPQGRSLWLYGDPAIAVGDIYSPWHSATRAASKPACTLHSEIKSLRHDYDAVILNCPKQQDEAEGLLALALERSKGFVMAVAAKDAGGGRLIDMMEAYGIPVDTLSKNRCRVVWTLNAAKARRDVIAKNIANLSLRKVNIGG